MRIIQSVGGFVRFVLLIFLAMGLGMFWDVHGLQRDLTRLATAMPVGASSWVIPLPSDRIGVITVYGDQGAVCGMVSVKQGAVRLAQIGGESVALTFQQGIDLRPHAKALAPCHRIHVGLLANLGFLKGLLSLEYINGKVTRVEPIRLWD